MDSSDVLWGPETAKALENFGTAGPAAGVFEGVPRRLIRAYAEVKLAALEALQETESIFTPDIMESLRVAATAVIRGDEDSAFPLPMAQGGAGTSLHMNLNEVLSNLVARKLGRGPDPIEDLARHQSTNDTFATASIVMAFRIAEEAEESVVALQEILVDLEGRYDGVLMCGRTELQDALPMRAGSLFGAWAGAVERDRWRLSKVAERVREVPLGGTAIGSGFGAPRRYAHAAERHLRRLTGLPLSRTQNMMDGVALKDTLAEVAAALRLNSLNTVRMTGDLLYYGSSPVGEINHPNLQYGSSMMPIKTNPVLLERCRGLALSAMAEADKVSVYAREGQLQLNAYLPFLLRALMTCAEECCTACADLRRFLESMNIDAERMERNLAGSRALLNALMPLIGYRALKELEEAVGREPPGNLDAVADLVAKHTGIAREKIAERLEPMNLTGPPRK